MISETKEKLFEKSLLWKPSKTFIDAPAAQKGALVWRANERIFLTRCVASSGAGVSPCKFLRRVQRCAFSKNVSLLVCAVFFCCGTAFAEDVLLDKSFDQPGNYVWLVPMGVSEVMVVEAVGGGGAGGQARHFSKWTNVCGGDSRLLREYNEEHDSFGTNGVSGSVIRAQVIVNLQYGDVLKIIVGAGGEGRAYWWDIDAGRSTHVTLFDQNDNQKMIFLSDGSVSRELVAMGGAGGVAGTPKICLTKDPESDKDFRSVADYKPINYKPGAGGHAARKVGMPADNGIDGRVKLTYVQATTGEEAALLAWQTYALTRQIGDYTRELGVGVEHANDVLDTYVQKFRDTQTPLGEVLETVEKLRNDALFSKEALDLALAQFEDLLFQSLSKEPKFFYSLLENQDGMVKQITE